MDISFDPAKRQATLTKRGLDFADAGLVFMGRTATRQDTRKAYGEDRFQTAGYLPSDACWSSGRRAMARGASS